ncbi:malto-oligosyltrehalose trehalohydrolase [Acidianus sp. HS-5]|uniref:malto-oligosyltrehalose trehalohydrolase n=1 Tax=Acidianus sp. HS-5 TaxID=2886040 RepID=UPI00308B3834|nr:malto-oligosyltrehalose trehalohydrolase [Acidianus sp. HS-5]
MDIGSNFDGKSTLFRLWTPYHKEVSLVLYKQGERKVIKMELEDEERGYFSLEVDEAKPGDRYSYLIRGKEYPDPASRFQPEGVHGKSEIVGEFSWEDEGWKGIDFPIIYELHVGAFGGDFEGVKNKLDYLKDLGVTAIELMPVHQFAGKRNWGYDGVLLYAVQNSYGGPQRLKELVNEAHKKGLGVILDVVYNHVGPEGNYLSVFGPYFSTRYKTPWGPIFNFDEAYSDEVRHYVVQNAVYWIKEYHIDGLRLDAVHSIFDNSPKHILEEIRDAVKEANGLAIAESDLNDPKIILPKEKCGYCIDAQWSDDFHHSLHALLTGEKDSYYADFGRIDQLAKAMKDVFVYDGIYSNFRKKTHGKPVGNLTGNKFVIYSQNHDQVGNRKDGKRLISLVGEKTLIAPFLYILSPYIPMIFMGEEYGENNPFLFFTDFSDPEIIKGLREGRKKELGEYYYDPQDYSTFEKSKLSWNMNTKILSLYKELIKLRKELFSDFSRNIDVKIKDNCIIVRRKEKYLIIACFGDSVLNIKAKALITTGNMPLLLPNNVSYGAGIYEEI